MSDAVYSQLLSAIAVQRLVIFSGAGLSMPAPSHVPSAAALARECARRFEEDTGETLPADLLEDIEGQARFFRERGQLQSYFLARLVDWMPFAGEPNAGHFAIADFLLCNAIDLSISANIDILVERAAEALGSTTFLSAVRGSEAAIRREHQPLLKLHGCYKRGPEQTLWCREQLSEQPWVEQLEDSVRWLAGGLTQRDVLFVGYWTDWAYLNQALDAVLRDQAPRAVTLVDPSSPEELERKAPSLWAWAHRDGITFNHVRLSGTDFLNELRRRFSLGLLKKVAAVAKPAYKALKKQDAPDFPPADGVSTDDLYDLRRDWSGVGRSQVTRRREPDGSDELLGQIFFELVAAGAVLDGSTLRLNGHKVRLVKGAGRMLYSLKSDLGEMSPFDAPDVTVCAGAHDDGGAAAHIVRPSRRPSVIRPGISGAWCNDTTARDILGLG
jgi:hypothetical protein